jgi:hypothetical protein
MNHRNRLAAGVFSLALIGATGVCHGVWTGRWHAAPDLTPMIAALDRIPMNIGQWHGKPASLDPGEIERTGASGSWMRTYEHESSGEIVSVLLIVGRPGPVAVHSPDVCYPAAGYEASEAPVHQRVTAKNGTTAEFWKVDFRKEMVPIPGRLRIYWAWRGSGGWSAPLTPRLAFAREDCLYKLYVVRSLPPSPENDRSDASVDFIETFLTQFDDQRVHAQK